MAITAKEYLSQLEELEKKVKHKKQQLADAKKNRGIVTISNDSEVGKVQTSFCGGEGRRTESQALRVVALEEEIENKIIDYMELQNKLIDQIHDLKDGLFIEILYRRYVRTEKDFTKMACDMGYSYKYVINMHGEALVAFENSHPEIFRKIES